MRVDGADYLGDQFTFSIDQVDAKGKRTDRLAGACHASAAHAAFDVFKSAYPNTSIVLRQGSRIIRSIKTGRSTDDR